MNVKHETTIYNFIIIILCHETNNKIIKKTNDSDAESEWCGGHCPLRNTIMHVGPKITGIRAESTYYAHTGTLQLQFDGQWEDKVLGERYQGQGTLNEWILNDGEVFNKVCLVLKHASGGKPNDDGSYNCISFMRFSTNQGNIVCYGDTRDAQHAVPQDRVKIISGDELVKIDYKCGWWLDGCRFTFKNDVTYYNDDEEPSSDDEQQGVSAHQDVSNQQGASVQQVVSEQQVISEQQAVSEQQIVSGEQDASGQQIVSGQQDESGQQNESGQQHANEQQEAYESSGVLKQKGRSRCIICWCCGIPSKIINIHDHILKHQIIIALETIGTNN